MRPTYNLNIVNKLTIQEGDWIIAASAEAIVRLAADGKLYTGTNFHREAFLEYYGYKEIKSIARQLKGQQTLDDTIKDANGQATVDRVLTYGDICQISDDIYDIHRSEKGSKRYATAIELAKEEATLWIEEGYKEASKAVDETSGNSGAIVKINNVGQYSSKREAEKEYPIREIDGSIPYRFIAEIKFLSERDRKAFDQYMDTYNMHMETQ